MRQGSFILIAALLVVSTASAATFNEEFDGSELDSAKWNVLTGNGSVILVDGFANLSAAAGQFPFLTPAANPFPPGDWSLKVRFRYPTVATCGNGFQSTRDGIDPFALSGFSFWQDLCCGPTRVTIGDVWPVYLGPGVDTEFHEYEWQLLGDTYFFFLDGRLVGMDQSELRPTGFFFGHPPGTTCSTWTSQMIDYIRIAVTAPTTTRRTTWARIKARYGDNSSRR